MFLRLCVRAPRMLIRWCIAVARYLPSEEEFKKEGGSGKTLDDSPGVLLAQGARYTPALASTTTDTPRAGTCASAFWYECGRLPGNASTSPVPTV